jgi:hypothetical protein
MKLPLFRLSFPTTFALAVAAFSAGACTSGVAPTAPIASTGDPGIVSPLPDAAPSALDPSSPPGTDAAAVLADCSRGGSAALDSGPVNATKIDASGLPIEDAGPSVPDDASGDQTRIDAGEISSPLGDDASVESPPYGDSCSSTSSACGAPLACQDLSLGDGATAGYACTQSCVTDADCGTSPAGFAPPVCESFTTGGFCVIRCNAATTCPSPLQCVGVDGEGPSVCLAP